jgi:hypothetical protein
MLVQSFATKKFGTLWVLVRIYIEAASGGVSGGTMASAVAMFEVASTDPFARQTYVPRAFPSPQSDPNSCP